MTYTATYSPDDNKIRLFAPSRLPEELYQRVKRAGFRWAPKQECFYSPTWTPGAEDLALELAGAIDDDDRDLMSRAEERAERFDGYQENRTRDANAAAEAVKRLADGIPLGQPILIGHHSERHARRDAEKIENGMRRAVKAFETAQYWKDRAAAAIGHAKYKERPDVRARRIKGIEADQRKRQRQSDEAAKFLKAYNDPQAMTAKWRDGRELLPALLATYEGGLTFEDHHAFEKGEIPFADALERARRNLSYTVSYCARWIEHYARRLDYERAMLEETGGTVTDRTGPEVGGACQCWASPGRYKGWSYIQKVNRISVTILDNWGNPADKDGSRNFTRTIPFDKLAGIMTRAQVEEARAAGRLVEIEKRGFILTDTAPKAEAAPQPEPTTPAPAAAPAPSAPELKAPAIADPAIFAAMAAQLHAGVKVISAPQLFPTPPELAARMIELAELEEGMRVLEPSAGTGQILGLLLHEGMRYDVVAVEINARLADMLRTQQDAGAYPGARIECADFLKMNGSIGNFDRVLMNPPFEKGADIVHILHARAHLSPGGRLVAICANGPRQREQLLPIASHWEDLPAGTFKNQGTGVNTALVILESET